VERGLHLFEAAEASLDRARAIDGTDDLPARAALALARGEDLTEHVAAAEAQAERYPNPANLSFLAALQAGLGHFDDADAHYREALAAYRDNSPFFLARIAFQRGVMWGEMADRPEWARALYEEAVRRLPDYVVANVHLAELEIEAEERLSAIARLERVLDAEDPEPEGRLAEYIDEGDAERAEDLRAQARSTYDALLESYPLAFADHASEFFSGAGADPQRALRLAEQNLENRRDARAYLIVIRAALTARESSRACELLPHAQPLGSVHPVLASELSGLEPTCP
jgi:tetratricopeptide (TPR) repeat protein